MPKEAGSDEALLFKRAFLDPLFGDPVSPFEKFTRRIELLECVPIRDQSGFRDFERKRKILIERGRSYFIDM